MFSLFRRRKVQPLPPFMTLDLTWSQATAVRVLIRSFFEKDVEGFRTHVFGADPCCLNALTTVKAEIERQVDQLRRQQA